MKGLLVEIWMLKAILVRTQKEESWRESLHLLREYINNHEQNVAEIWTLKAILVRCQTEIKNMLWETEGKAILIKWQ